MTDPSAIDKLLAQARSVLDRVPVEDLADEVAQGAILIDVRPLEQRRRDGDLPGAIVVNIPSGSSRRGLRPRGRSRVLLDPTWRQMRADLSC